MKNILLAASICTVALMIGVGAIFGANVVIWEVGAWGLLAFAPAIFVSMLALAGAATLLERIPD